MSNTLDVSGLTIKTNTEVVSDLTTGMQGIYGADINVNQNSPDGQLIQIFAQTVTDILELLLDSYNSFSVANAYGVALDQRVALNGITRRAGTFTITNITVTATQAVTIYGLSELLTNPAATVFMVADSTGNQFQLVTTHAFGGAGSTALVFQSAILGAVETTLNTITNIVTATIGISTVNNPTAVTTLGVDEESDADLKIRHSKSFFLAAQSPAEAVQAAMLDVSGCIDALVVENATAGTVNGTLAHTIWCINNGGTDLAIATAIYLKKAPGCGMRGAVTQAITRPNGASVTMSFDHAVEEDLYTHFSIVAFNGTDTFDSTTVKAALVAALTYKLNQTATIGDIVKAMAIIAPNGYLTGVAVSTNGSSWVDSVSPTSAKYYFQLATARITIV